MVLDMIGDMIADPGIVCLLESKLIAINFYSAICNIDWCKIDIRSDDEKLISKLRGDSTASWSASWRFAAGSIADIRHTHYNSGENYLDFYCAGNEGTITNQVRQELYRIGWIPCDEKNVYE